jgi:hypothetical protein
MTDSTPPAPHKPTVAGASHVELALTLELEPGGESALLRALSVLHRRRCRVTGVEYEAAPSPAGTPERLNLRLHAPPAHAHCVAAWLSALVEVHRVIV